MHSKTANSRGMRWRNSTRKQPDVCKLKNRMPTPSRPPKRTLKRRVRDGEKLMSATTEMDRLQKELQRATSSLEKGKDAEKDANSKIHSLGNDIKARDQEPSDLRDA